jgi:hypothetical protein
MSKFLLTVCALGLLSSSALAQEKSPEQMLEKQQLARVVTSGTNQRIGFFYAVNPDCSASGDVNVRVTKQPRTRHSRDYSCNRFPHLPKRKHARQVQ